MARLPEAVIEQIKRDISLLRLVEQQGYQPKRQGKDYAISCPFHKGDNTPSLIISPKSNLYHCFGCGAAGSVIDWVMKTQQRSFREAVAWLRNDCLPFDKASPLPPASPETPLLAANAEEDQALLQQVIDFYHQTLKQSPEGLDYLKRRGLDDPTLIETFKLGYANRTLGPILPEKSRKAGSEIRSQLQRIGLYRDSGHEHFNGSLVIPVMDQAGVITEVYGRKLLNNLRKGTPKHLYLPGPHAGVFNPAGLQHEEVILCESLLDALTFWRWGFHYVTSSYGIEGFTEELLQALRQSPVKRVLIAYDRDEAGNRAAKKASECLIGAGLDCYRVLFPKGMDANEYALTVTPPRKSLELVLRQAEWLGQGADPRQATAVTVPSEPPPLATDLPASPVPVTTPPTIEAEVADNETVITFGERRYRIRGLQKALSYETLKINLCVTAGDQLHVDQLDLYHAKQRYSFAKQAAVELGVTEAVIKQDLAKVLLKLEQLQDEQIQQATTPAEKAPTLSDEARVQALDLLTDPNLLDRILNDFERAGVVGEETNKLVGYLAAVSRKLDNPLAVMIQSTSAAGKSSLMNAVLAMMPEEERIQYSAMTGQSLFYMGETNLKHKILAIAEEEGADQASYALKLLQSEGELTIASTGKDADGNLTTQEYRVEGPVMLFSTTTAIDIDEELLNRCLVLTVNESREQTRLIHALQRQRETLAGLLMKADRQAILDTHRNAQRLLKPLAVVNPYAPQLTFMDNQTRSRRDHMKYLQLIKTIALLHQYQRKTKTVEHQGKTLSYIEVVPADIDTANRLASDVLGRSLDELPPQTRQLLGLITTWVEAQCQQHGMAQQDYRFSRRDVREATGWSDNQLKVHCSRLTELEYLGVHSGSRGHALSYELLFAGDVTTEKPQLMGLLSRVQLQTPGYDEKKLGGKGQKLGQKAEKLPPSCPQDGAKLAPSWGVENAKNAIDKGLNGKHHEIAAKPQYKDKKTAASHPTHTFPLAADPTGVNGCHD